MAEVSRPSANAYTLDKILWDFFITFTWRRIPPPLVRKRIMLEWIRRAAAKYKCNYQWEMLWVVRHELGERFGRPHFHVLIKLPDGSSSNRTSAKFQLEHLWKETIGQKPGYPPVCGHMDIRTYDSSRNAAAYVVKDTGWDTRKANEYELAKFCSDRAWAQDQEVYLITSPSVPWTLFKRMRRRRSPKGDPRSRYGGGRCARFLKDLKQGSVRQGGKISPWSPKRLTHPADDRAGRLYC